jgi:hypothetical protein
MGSDYQIPLQLWAVANMIPVGVRLVRKHQR